MSCVIVVTPVLRAVWPVISPAVTAAAASMGFNVAPLAQRLAATNTPCVEIDLEESEIAAEPGHSILIERDGVRGLFTCDARGKLKLRVEGANHSKAELQSIGQDLIDRVTQQYVYHRVITELKQRRLSIVDEEVMPDRTVKIRVRNI